MFIGHTAVGFASKRTAPRTSLGWLMAAPMLLDFLWPVFLLAGIEQVRITPNPRDPFFNLEFVHYPWSHSLLMAIIWSILFAAIHYWRTRYAAGAITIGFGVASHWILDFVTHRPDLPLWPGGPKVGLGLWSSPTATMIVESLLYVAGFVIYLRATRARDRVGSVALWALGVILFATYVASAASAPPDTVPKLAGGALVLLIIPFWAAWIDRHREARV